MVPGELLQHNPSHLIFKQAIDSQTTTNSRDQTHRNFPGATMKTRSTTVSIVRSFLTLLAAVTVLTSAFAQKLAVNSADFPALGNPTSAIETPDGRYVFASVTNLLNCSHGHTAGDTGRGTRWLARAGDRGLPV